MNVMKQNKRLRKVFRLIDEMLWACAETPSLSVSSRTVAEERAVRIGTESKRTQKIITAYLEQRTAMMQNLITDERFAKYPLPRRRIGLWWRILSRIAAWKAIHALRKRERQDRE